MVNFKVNPRLMEICHSQSQLCMEQTKHERTKLIIPAMELYIARAFYLHLILDTFNMPFLEADISIKLRSKSQTAVDDNLFK